MFVIIRGAGDIASGIALRLHRCGIRLLMTEIAHPTSIRRSVCFSEAVFHKKTQVEDVHATLAEQIDDCQAIWGRGEIAVMVDPEGTCLQKLSPDALVDAILAKKNLGTAISDAPVVVGVGPGFCAGKDCHAVVETMRGHYLGRVIYHGEPIPNTNIPGLIGGFAGERVLRAPCDGIFEPQLAIGTQVKAGEIAGIVGTEPMLCTIDGILRGILPAGTAVHRGMKSGDIDPRCKKEHCYCASDKALAVGGGVLEAILYLSKRLENA